MSVLPFALTLNEAEGNDPRVPILEGSTGAEIMVYISPIPYVGPVELMRELCTCSQPIDKSPERVGKGEFVWTDFDKNWRVNNRTGIVEDLYRLYKDC